ncbi:MAG: hypothetical protein JXR48_12365 [Candidatus Delongbacteria bacterium]|nr:hypothetical protein [Candidatus Delongbacteria bacterium]MBN2835746.1 hypothetical protein [Candidatus Delongbacteria bacterium]
MKYQNFNSSCVFTAMANMLESYDIDVEDYDIVKSIYIPYQLRFERNSYINAYKLQSKFWLDLYLNKHNLEIINHELDLEEKIKMLKNSVHELKVSVKFPNERGHALVFNNYENEKFKFTNIRHKKDDAPDYKYFTEDELRSILFPKSPIGEYKEKICENFIGWEYVFKESLEVLDNYEKDIFEDFEIYKSAKEHLDDRERLYFPLLLGLPSMMELEGENDFVAKLLLLRDQYLKAIKSGESFCLKDKLDSDLLQNCIIDFKILIKKKLDVIL